MKRKTQRVFSFINSQKQPKILCLS